MNVSIGDLMRERIVAEGIPPGKVTVIPNWADGDAVMPVAHEENPLRREWGLEGKFVVGYTETPAQKDAGPLIAKSEAPRFARG